MIRLIITAAQWGTDPLEDVNVKTNEPIKGRQINLFDAESNILVQVPFSGDSLKALIGDLAQGLTDAQRRQLVPVFTGGIILPENGAGR